MRCRRRNLKKSSLSSRHETVFSKEFSFTEKSFPSTNSLFFVIFSFLLSIVRPPEVYLNKKTPSHFQEQQQRIVGAGSGISTHAPRRAQANTRAYSRHAPACYAY